MLIHFNSYTTKIKPAFFLNFLCKLLILRCHIKVFITRPLNLVLFTQINKVVLALVQSSERRPGRGKIPKILLVLKLDTQF